MESNTRGLLINDVLEPPPEFPFPFTPYPIQHDFMTALYSALENHKLGIFESPTGTGKSMSMICSALTWLEDNEKRIRQALERDATPPNIDNSDNCDWIAQQAKQIEEAAKCAVKKKELKLLEAKEQEMRDLVKRVAARHKQAEMKINQTSRLHYSKKSEEEEVKEENDDIELILEDYSEYEENNEDDEEEEEHTTTKIFFCSRTHSQLSQLVSELRRSVHHDKRVVCLASRQNYCVNPAVQSLGSLVLINDRCLDLQEGRVTTARDKDGCRTKQSRRCGGCLYKTQEKIQVLREEALAEVKDVEDLVKKGKELKACPYYAARAALKDAQVVMLPYNTLLHAATRETSGICLKGNIVIIDEAHNLLDTIVHMYSAMLTGKQISDALDQLKAYRNCYEKRFSAINILRLDQLIFYIGRLFKLLGIKSEKMASNEFTGHNQKPVTKVFRLVEFGAAAGVESINPYTLLEFCRKSKLAHKLRGFANRKPGLEKQVEKKAKGLLAFVEEKLKESEPNKQEFESKVCNEPSTKNAMLSILSFLECLTSKCGNGVVICCQNINVEEAQLKFLLLNPAEHFKTVVQDARAVIVAGGTMQPVSEFRDQLFFSAGGTSERILQFSCDHVVPPENILPIALATGPGGRQLMFTYESRTSPEMLMEVERILCNVCNVVPGGIVCFFPSYDYLGKVSNFMSKNGTFEKLQVKKKILQEPRDSKSVEKILHNYANAIRKASLPSTGALLLSVVGGKLSEGLNFSDDLGRLVIVIGMPYPNRESPELREKMSYLDSSMGSGTGQKYYEALCMKAVNQSIGRAIRHREDYASVLLVDNRYLRPTIQASLPGWIQRSLFSCEKFGEALAHIRQFFIMKKK